MTGGTRHGKTRQDRRNGRFISAASARVQQVQALADLPDQEWAIDEVALEILEAGMAKAREEGWQPPASPHEREVG
jgi:hypothetical protein